MAYLINGNNLLETWQRACGLLRSNGKSCFNVILEIENPTDFTDLAQWILERNPQDFAGSDNIEDVINTIFPYKLFERNNFSSREEFYECYQQVYSRGRSIRPRQSWGTYFQRLLNYSSHFRETNGKNQLERAIVALQEDRARKCAIVFHLSSANLDSNTRVLGGPCWQFGEILWTKDTNTIDLFVVYRNHDYFNKTLGNLVGLAKLLEFLCNQTNKNPGRLIVHSANAYYSCNNTTIQRITR